MERFEKNQRLLAARIRRRRQRLGLSQETLAFKSGIDRSYMGGIERGQRNPSLRTLCLIASALGIDLGALLRDLPGSD